MGRTSPANDSVLNIQRGLAVTTWFISNTLLSARERGNWGKILKLWLGFYKVYIFSILEVWGWRVETVKCQHQTNARNPDGTDGLVPGKLAPGQFTVGSGSALESNWMGSCQQACNVYFRLLGAYFIKFFGGFIQVFSNALQPSTPGGLNRRMQTCYSGGTWIFSNRV